MRSIEEFLHCFENGELKSWSHKYFVRVIWSYLKIFGRQRGLKKCFSALEIYQGSGYTEFFFIFIF